MFIRQNEMVFFEEVPLEVETIPGGTVLFHDSCYSDKEGTSFNVRKGRLDGYYVLDREDKINAIEDTPEDWAAYDKPGLSTGLLEGFLKEGRV